MKKQFRGATLVLSLGIALTLAMTMLSLGLVADASHIQTVELGVVKPFAILAGTPVISDAGGTSVITGNVGLNPRTGASIGLTCAQVTGTIYSVDPAGPLPCRVTNAPLLVLASGALNTAIGDAAGRLGGVAVNPNPLTPNELSAQVLAHGIYKSTALSMNLAVGGTVTLNGGPNDVFIFQIPTLLTIGNASEVKLQGGVQSCNVFWQVADATIGTTAKFVGTILAQNAITVANGSSIDGRLLAHDDRVTLINDTIAVPTCASAGAGAAAGPTITYDTVCIDNALIQRTFMNGIAVAQTRLAGPCTSGPYYYTTTSSPTVAPAAATPSVAPATATPAPSIAPAVAPSATPLPGVLALPFTATGDGDSLAFLILPLVVIAFAVLYLVARARRRARHPTA